MLRLLGMDDACFEFTIASVLMALGLTDWHMMYADNFFGLILLGYGGRYLVMI